MESDPAVEKRQLRAEIRHRRRGRPGSERVAAGEAIRDHLAAFITTRRFTRVACYLSTDDEPSTRPFLTWAAENGVDVLLPVSRPDGLLDWVAGEGSDEAKGLFGIVERVGPVLEPGAVNSVDLMIIPAAAIDRSGMRMGWGRGYFDRTLSSVTSEPVILGAVFDDELVRKVPSEGHDLPVHGAVTPSGLVIFGSV